MGAKNNRGRKARVTLAGIKNGQGAKSIVVSPEIAGILRILSGLSPSVMTACVIESRF